MSGPRCALCGTPVDDAAVCYLCVEGDADGYDLRGSEHPALARNLGDIDGLSRALVVKYTRQTRTGDRVGSRSRETAEPADQRASRAASELRNELTTTVRLLDLGDAPTIASSPAMALWLLGRLERIRHHAAAPDMVRGVGRSVERVREVVDLPPELQFLGTCGYTDEYGTCMAELYAGKDAETIRCPSCDTGHDVAARRKDILAALDDQFAYASQLAGTMSMLGEDVTAERIWKWAERGRLRIRGHDMARRPLYRIGDVADLLIEAAHAAAKKFERVKR